MAQSIYNQISGYGAPAVSGRGSGIVALNGNNVAIGTCLSPSGDSIGYIADGKNDPEAIQYSRDATNTIPKGIDDRNDVVGTYNNNHGDHAFARLSDKTYINLENSIKDAAGNPLPVIDSDFSAESSGGEAAGYYTTTDGHRHIFIASSSNSFKDITPVILKVKQVDQIIDEDSIRVRGVNDEGDIVGTFNIDDENKVEGFVADHNGNMTIIPKDSQNLQARHGCSR